MLTYKDALLRNTKPLSRNQKKLIQSDIQSNHSFINTNVSFCNDMIMLPEEIWRKIIYYLDTDESDINIIKSILNICFTNKIFYKIISDNVFWITKNKNYDCAKFNIYNSICRFVKIYDKLKNTNLYFRDLHLYSGESINSKKYDINDVPYNCKLNTDTLYMISREEYYDYCVLYGGPFEHACMWYTIYIHDYFNNDFYDIWQEKCTHFEYSYSNGSYVVYGNYVWCSDEYERYDSINKKGKGGMIYVYNILTHEKYIIKETNDHYSFKRIDRSLYLCHNN